MFAGFFIDIKTPYYAPKRNKNQRNSAFFDFIFFLAILER